MGKLTQPSDNAEKVMDNMDKVRYRDRLPGTQLIYNYVHLCFCTSQNESNIDPKMSFLAKGKHLYVPLNGRRPVFINATFVDVSWFHLHLCEAINVIVYKIVVIA